MATDKEIRQEAKKVFYCLDTASTKKRIIEAIIRGIDIGKKEGIQIEQERSNKYKVFHDHIKVHLKPNQEVICKICGKSIDNIWDDFDGSK